LKVDTAVFQRVGRVILPDLVEQNANKNIKFSPSLIKKASFDPVKNVISSIGSYFASVSRAKVSKSCEADNKSYSMRPHIYAFVVKLTKREKCFSPSVKVYSITAEYELVIDLMIVGFFLRSYESFGLNLA